MSTNNAFVALRTKRFANYPLLKDRILYASCYRTFAMSLPIVEGGEPITLETAFMLRNTLFGETKHGGPSDWQRAHFVFNDIDSNFSYGLMIPKNNTRPALMCIQAYILKNLLFKETNSRSHRNVDEMELLSPAVGQREEALIFAIADLLWKAAAETKKAWICLPSEEEYIEKSSKYELDGTTEKLQLFPFENFDDIPEFLGKYLHILTFEEGAGLMIVLYSIILSYGSEQIHEDLNGEQSQLVPGVGESQIPLVTLLLTGHATPYLHNGTQLIPDNDLVNRPKNGICGRSEIGFLIFWSNEEQSKEVGSRMKTPMLPIWLTCIDEHYGVLFNPNRELMRDHRAEHCFDLHYYNSSSMQREPTILNLDTRFSKEKEDYELPLLERLILTRWQEASVNWNGTSPFV